MRSYLDFEKPVADLQGKVQELRALEKEGDAVAIGEEIARLEAKAAQALGEIYGKLSPWQKTQVARHPDRPHTSDYARALIEDFTPLAGDRKFGEDAAIVAGLGFFRGKRVALIGHEKGNDTESRLKHNFGMARPEGYRKAVRIMELADRFGLPVIALVDTAGAYPGLDAEERGQAEAIARSTEACVNLGVPNVAVVIGEGGSGGAISIATANKVLMLEHSIYTVISPEGAASILWHDSSRAQDAATGMKITAEDLHRFGVIDRIIPEPIGGAHREPETTIKATGEAIAEALDSLDNLPPEEIRRQRREKYPGDRPERSSLPTLPAAISVPHGAREDWLSRSRICERGCRRLTSVNLDRATRIPACAGGRVGAARGAAWRFDQSRRECCACSRCSPWRSLVLAGCNYVRSAQGTSVRCRAFLVAKMRQLAMKDTAPIFIRIFKEESQMEIWKQRADGRYGLLKTYSICKWSGALGPEEVRKATGRRRKASIRSRRRR